jgi:hypothetical protein
MTGRAADEALAGPGWRRVAGPEIAAWAQAAREPALAALAADPAPRRSGGTWQPGVDLLASDALGGIAGAAFPWEALGLAPRPMQPGQLSAVHPGYPQAERPPGADPAAARRNLLWEREACNAHVDGLAGDKLHRPRAWIAGLPLTRADPGASPLVVWEGSHRLILRAFRSVLSAHPPETWPQVDLGPAYRAARAEAMRTCPFRALPGVPGEAVVLHRLALHGIAPWAPAAAAEPGGRVITYFRPSLERVEDWIDAAV